MQVFSIWSGLRVSKEKMINNRFLEAKSAECEKSESSMRRGEISTHEQTGSRTHSRRLLAGFHAPFRPKTKSTAFAVLYFGADYGARTRHLNLGKVALYQMS